MEGAGFVLTSQRKKLEFSKLILTIAEITNVAVICFSFVMIWRTMDLAPLVYLIPGSFAQIAAARGFYTNKAKVENIVKLQHIYKDLPILEKLMGDNKQNDQDGGVG